MADAILDRVFAEKRVLKAARALGKALYESEKWQIDPDVWTGLRGEMDMSARLLARADRRERQLIKKS